MSGARPGAACHEHMPCIWEYPIFLVPWKVSSRTEEGLVFVGLCLEVLLYGMHMAAGGTWTLLPILGGSAGPHRPQSQVLQRYVKVVRGHQSHLPSRRNHLGPEIVSIPCPGQTSDCFGSMVLICEALENVPVHYGTANAAGLSQQYFFPATSWFSSELY